MIRYHTKQPLNAININPCQDGISAPSCLNFAGRHSTNPFTFKFLQWKKYSCIKIINCGMNSEIYGNDSFYQNNEYRNW